MSSGFCTQKHPDTHETAAVPAETGKKDGGFPHNPAIL